MTATLTAGAPVAVSAHGSSLAGTGALVRFHLRRDRIRIPVWIVAITGMTLAVNSSWQDLYSTPDQLRDIARTLNSPAMVAMVGINYAGVEGTTYGSMMAQQMFWFTLIGAAVMSILLMTRYTRAEEEAGRAELVRSNVVGRHAYLTSALIVVGGANLAIGLLTAVGLGAMGIETIDWPGSWLYGAGHVAVGMVFAAIAAITAQVTEHSRGASGLAFTTLAVAYLLRAMGDVSENWLSWISPIGWAQATEVYVRDLWWPLSIAVVAAVGFAVVAFELSTRRDVGAGLRATRPGTATGSAALGTPFGFALRLHRGMMIGFGVAVLLLGMSYGSILGDVEELLANVSTFEQLIEGIQADLLPAFASMILTIMAMFSSVWVVIAMQRPRGEETSGRVEAVLSTAVSRTRWLGAHVATAVIGGPVMLFLVGAGFAVAGAGSTGDTALVGDLIGSSLAYSPALWVVIGVSVALFGWLPRAQPLTWIIVVYSIFVIYLGNILQVPDWMRNLSPFGHVPQMPASDFDIVPLLSLTALAAALIAFGMYGFRRRDLETK